MAATLGERLRLLVREKGLEQQQIAMELGLKTSTFNGYVGDKREPSIMYLKKLASYFDVSIDYLIGYSDVRGFYLEHLPNVLFEFVCDPINSTYIELAKDIKDRTNIKENDKKTAG